MKHNVFAKSLSLMAAAVMAATLAGCGDDSSSGSQSKQLVRISSNQIEAHPDVQALKVFEREVEKKLGDKFDIQIYPNATLGANEKVLELIKQGSVQFLVLSTANIETFDPLYSLFSIPYVFTSEEEYEKYMAFFEPDLYNPKEWARMAKEAGMKYAVITTKHHEGFCMFETKYTDYQSMNAPLCRKDLIREWVDAAEREPVSRYCEYSPADHAHSRPS